MYKKLLLVLLFSVVTLKGSVSFTSNVISSTGEKDTIEVKAEGYVKEAERIFKETENDIEERRSRISQFTSKVTKVLSTPFTKALTKVTLIQMEVICSAMPDLESAGFATFPQAYILIEVLGKKYVDSGQVIKALSNKRNDWKFRWLMAERIGTWGLKGAKDIMMEIILDKGENDYLRYECLFMVPARGKTYEGKPIGEYFIEIFKEEKELREMSALKLGLMRYEPAVELLLQTIEEDSFSIKPIKALGYMKSEKALPGLFKLLNEEEYRRSVVIALGRIGGEQVVDTLINLWGSAKKKEKYNLEEGLAFTDSDRAYEFLIQHQCVKALGRAAWFGKYKALDALVQIGTPEALKKLSWLSTLRGSGVPEIKHRAKILLKEIEDEE